MKPLHVTDVLALAGLVDYSWCTDEGLFRGSEAHRAVNLRIRGQLKKRTLPGLICNYVAAYDRFRDECHFLASDTEIELEDAVLGLCGRADAFGYVQKVSAIVDFKTGAIVPATRIQLTLYGHMLKPGKWWTRHAVRLNADGTYSMKTYPLATWQADKMTALAAVRVAQWRVANGLVRV